MIYAVLEIILRALDLWSGLKDYINKKELEEMRSNLLKIHEAELNAQNAQNSSQIFAVQSDITKSQ